MINLNISPPYSTSSYNETSNFSGFENLGDIIIEESSSSQPQSETLNKTNEQSKKIILKRKEFKLTREIKEDLEENEIDLRLFHLVRRWKYFEEDLHTPEERKVVPFVQKYNAWDFKGSKLGKQFEEYKKDQEITYT